ncbi:MAG: hypothetical protein FWF52_04305 [Candidatus Azobacteroides sp.]|nr:hypothetical protein [Candidatus Azobacteroides sp.]
MNQWDKQHLINLGLSQKQIDRIFNAAVKEAAAIGVSLYDFNPDKPFSFADYPKTKERINKVLKELCGQLEITVVNGVRSEWTLANNKNNALCDRVFGGNKYKLTKEQERKYYSNNDQAREAFIARKTAGLNLSDRVWNYTKQFKAEIEMGLDLGIRNGLSAAETARDLKQYLKEPNKLFRRVRDEHGQLQLSKAAKDYHPGAGVYRSSYKNALRLTVTETNIAYHTADYERWKQLDFVVGIEICLSGNHTLNGLPFADICDDLAGKYPKTFQFTGWHPQCRCHAVSILKTEKEMEKDEERIMNGEEPSVESENSVKYLPENFKKWIADNKDRIEAAEQRGTLPYFIKDNANFVEISAKDLNLTNRSEYIREARTQYNLYGSEWQRDYFNRDNGGYLVIDKQRIEHSKISKNEKEKFDKEYAMSMIFAQNGYKIEMLKERSGFSSSDITINGITAELKKTSGSGNIEKYAKKAIREQGAKKVVFEFENNLKDIHTKLLKLGKVYDIHGYFYFSDNKNKIFEF